MDIQATPPHPEIAVEEEIREIPNIANAPLDRNPYSKDSGYQKYETAANKDPHPSCTTDKIEGGELATEGGEGGVKPTPIDAEDVEMREEHLRPETAQGREGAGITSTTVPVDVEMTDQPEPMNPNPAARNTAARLRGSETMETEVKQELLKRHAPETQGETKRRHREGIKRNRRSMPEVAYEELEDDLDEYDEPKRCRWNVNCIFTPCNCKKEFQPMRRRGTVASLETTRGGGAEKREGRYRHTEEEDVTVQPRREQGEAGRRGNSGKAAAMLQQDPNQTPQFYRNTRKGRKSKLAYIMKLGMLLLMLFTCATGAARWKDDTQCKETTHQIKVNDCNIPISLRKYVIPEHCLTSGFTPNTNMMQEKLPGTIIVKERIDSISGAVCVARKSQFRGYCGAYSHWKFMQVPEIEVGINVSPQVCQKALREKQFVAPDGKIMDVKMDEEILYQYGVRIHHCSSYQHLLYWSTIEDTLSTGRLFTSSDADQVHHNKREVSGR